MKNGMILIAFICFTATTANADVAKQITKVFGGMVNVTPETSYAGQRSNSYHGPSVVLRNRITNAVAIGFVPASISAGCGGIDMFGGSISFIKKAELEQLLRNIASNASGYLFQLALTQLCPSCVANIESMQKKIQSLTNMSLNSCNIATDTVDWMLADKPPAEESVTHATRKKIGYKNRNDALATDDADMLAQQNTTNPEKTSAAAGLSGVNNTDFVGNILWNRLVQANTDSWFGGATEAGQQTREAIISLIGTASMKMNATNDSLTMDEWTSIIGLKEFLEGGSITMYTCATDTAKCLTNKATAQVTIVGFKQKVKDILLGNGVSTGIVTKLKNPMVAPLNATEISFVNHVKGPIYAMLIGLAKTRDGGGSSEFAERLLPVLSAKLVWDLITEYVETAEKSLLGAKEEQKPMISKLVGIIKKRKKELEVEYKQLLSEEKATFDALKIYRNMLEVSKKLTPSIIPETQPKDTK